MAPHPTTPRLTGIGLGRVFSFTRPKTDGGHDGPLGLWRIDEVAGDRVTLTRVLRDPAAPVETIEAWLTATDDIVFEAPPPAATGEAPFILGPAELLKGAA